MSNCVLMSYFSIPGPLSMSSSPTSLRARTLVSRSASRSPGLPTARRSLVASPTTSSGCGPSSHNGLFTPHLHDDLHVVPYFADEKSAWRHRWVVGCMGSWRDDKWLYVRSAGCVFFPLLHVAQNPSFALHIHIWTELFEVSLFNGGLLARRHWVSGHPMTMLRIIDP